MRRKLLVLAGLCFAFAGCEQNSADIKPINVNKTASVAATPSVSPSISPTPAPTATPDQSKIKTFKGKGMITKINLELVSVELDHEEIKGLMPAMIMEFYVKEKRELEVLKVGDKVDFILEDNAGQEKIISIEKAK